MHMAAAPSTSSPTLQRIHPMPFGAELENGAVRFRLWAPGAQSVALVLEGEEINQPLHPKEEGWFELLTPLARVGNRYYFVLADGTRVPDPASRFQPEDVHGPSEVIDPSSYLWADDGWEGGRGRKPLSTNSTWAHLPLQARFNLPSTSSTTSSTSGSPRFR